MLKISVLNNSYWCGHFLALL